MRKNISLIVIGLFLVILTGCGTESSNYVEREEYDNVISELEELKSQVEEMEREKEDYAHSQSLEETKEDNQPAEEFREGKKELLGDFSFYWDENNTVLLSVYKEGEKYCVYGSGNYEEEKEFLLKWNYYWLCEFTGLYASEAEIKIKIGEEEYLYKVEDGNITDEYNPENSGFGIILPDEYKEKGEEWWPKINEFYQSTIWK